MALCAWVEAPALGLQFGFGLSLGLNSKQLTAACFSPPSFCQDSQRDRGIPRWTSGYDGGKGNRRIQKKKTRTPKDAKDMLGKLDE